MIRFRSLIWLSIAIASAACGRGPGDARLDAVTLRARVAADERVVELLAEADSRAVKGDGRGALAIVDEQIAPLVKENVERARSTSPTTPWGKERLASAIELVTERERTVTAYRDALSSDDVERVVRAMEAERPVDERAQKLEAEIASPPAPAGC